MGDAVDWIVGAKLRAAKASPRRAPATEFWGLSSVGLLVGAVSSIVRSEGASEVSSSSPVGARLGWLTAGEKSLDNVSKAAWLDWAAGVVDCGRLV